jgi:hypothetical protein
MWIQFLGVDDNVLGTAELAPGWCNDCGEIYAETDTPVNADDVCSVRLVVEDGAECCPTWMSLRVLCDDNCGCGDWEKVFKGCIWCWSRVP